MHYIKVLAPPRQRQRVRELANEVGRTVSEVRDALTSIGEYVASDNSFLEAPVIRRVREALGVPDEQPSLQPQPTSPAPALAAGLSPPKVRPQRDNHPLMDLPSVQRRDRRAHRESDGPRGRTSDRDSSWGSESANNAGFAAPDEAAPAWEHEEWKLYRFTEVEREAWLAEGLRPGQAKVARNLRDAGLVPSDLSVVISGWSVGARLAKGEGAAAVVRLLQRHREKGSA